MDIPLRSQANKQVATIAAGAAPQVVNARNSPFDSNCFGSLNASAPPVAITPKPARIPATICARTNTAPITSARPSVAQSPHGPLPPDPFTAPPEPSSADPRRATTFPDPPNPTPARHSR